MEARDEFQNYQRIVVKIGTSSLTYPNGRFNLKTLERLSWVLSDIRNQGKEVVLVSSGSIGVGSVRLAFSERPTDIRKKQAAAAVGQAALIQMYQGFFMQYNQKVAQILLTKDDMRAEDRKTNLKNTFETLMELEVIPIVNANDSISTFEIEFSDNDRLSALVAELVGADLLVILTDIDALYDSDPKANPNAKRISFVEAVTDDVERMAGTKGSEFSFGGMKTKIEAAKLCEQAGIDMVIAQASDPVVLEQILSGEDIGTLFSGKKHR